MSYIEKRRYYRINDVIGLDYSLNDGDEDCNSHAVALGAADELPQLIARIDREYNRAANILCHENVVLSEALCLLNKKVELLAKAVLPQDKSDSNELSETQVNISACGMAFLTENRLEPDTSIHLRLCLKPSNAMLEFDGQVVACEGSQRGDAENWLLRVDFVDADYMAQEELIQHIVQRQCVQLAAAGAEQA